MIGNGVFAGCQSMMTAIETCAGGGTPDASTPPSVPAPSELTTLRYVATPLPSVTLVEAERSIALPARMSELAASDALAPALLALSRLSARAPEVTTLDLVVAPGSDKPDNCVIICATATLEAPEGEC